MKKKLLAALLSVAMIATMFAGCGKKEDKVIKLMAFTDEVGKMVQLYLDNHPDLGYKLDETIVATTDGAYQPALDEMLKSEDSAPDLYALEAAFVLKYTQGDAAGFAATYDDLGIDTSAKLKEAQIATYASEVGTRPSDKKVVALPYQATGGAFIYRRSIAKDVWGTDDPATVSQKLGGGSQSWDQFWVAAEELKAKGYGIISGDGDIWHAIENSSDSAWVVDGKLVIDPKREALLDISMMLKEKNYSNGTQDWTDAWYADMKGEGEKQIFGFFGPAWLINYTIAPNCGGSAVGEGTYGDWAVTDSPVGFCWGGTYIASSANAVKKMSDEKKQVVADIIEWITLDASNEGLQYKWANGTEDWDKDPATVTAKDTVASGKVMSVSDGSLEILGGQNMFDYFVPAGDYATGANMTQYDETINSKFRDAVRAYVAGEVDRAGAIEKFKNDVKSVYADIVVE